MRTLILVTDKPFTCQQPSPPQNHHHHSYHNHDFLKVCAMRVIYVCGLCVYVCMIINNLTFNDGIKGKRKQYCHKPI